VPGLVFSPDGRTLAVTGRGGMLRLGSPLPTPGDAQLAVALSPGGKQLSAVGSTPGFATTRSDPGRSSPRRVGGALSRAQWAEYLPEARCRDVCPR